jgi:hypothetical protein
MFDNASRVHLTVAVNLPQPPHCCPPDTDDPEQRLIREHDVRPVFLCQLHTFSET